MSKAEKRALEAYPILFSERHGYDDTFKDRRESYIKGYHQAEKDLELGWEDIREIYSILLNVQGETSDDYLLTLSIPERIENEHREYKEVLKRFKALKDGKED